MRLLLLVLTILTGYCSCSYLGLTAYASETSEQTSYNEDCILDELDWIEDISELSSELEYFYDKTGVQPYIYLRSYDETLSSDDDKLEFAENWYDENIDDEDTFLYLYFAEEDTDNDVGYMCYVSGENAAEVIDDEAVEIFWNNIDQYWPTDLSTVDMFATVFTNTADFITQEGNSDNSDEEDSDNSMVPATPGEPSDPDPNNTAHSGKRNILGTIFIIVLVAIIVAFVIYLIRDKRKQKEDNYNSTYNDY